MASSSGSANSSSAIFCRPAERGTAWHSTVAARSPARAKQHAARRAQRSPGSAAPRSRPAARTGGGASGGGWLQTAAAARLPQEPPRLLVVRRVQLLGAIGQRADALNLRAAARHGTGQRLGRFGGRAGAGSPSAPGCATCQFPAFQGKMASSQHTDEPRHAAPPHLVEELIADLDAQAVV